MLSTIISNFWEFTWQKKRHLKWDKCYSFTNASSVFPFSTKREANTQQMYLIAPSTPCTLFLPNAWGKTAFLRGWGKQHLAWHQGLYGSRQTGVFHSKKRKVYSCLSSSLLPLATIMSKMSVMSVVYLHLVLPQFLGLGSTLFLLAFFCLQMF